MKLITILILPLSLANAAWWTCNKAENKCSISGAHKIDCDPNFECRVDGNGCIPLSDDNTRYTHAHCH
ncbi:hypothetical protein HRS9139_10401 [Pyrenophora teres f. teres]|uniref:Uncharacterized protein n=1 Tax=Pyrenophora teres f. teres TaxID=97479 RepID=A0A6S6WBH1_9PLEO|nr:hypothetical protein HRS9139_10401 [Pyrenophora teres f. teres]CAE7205164.1 hypothetical protein PTTW11_09250 [Pyrenophora teres f. teres]